MSAVKDQTATSLDQHIKEIRNRFVFAFAERSMPLSC